MNDLSAVAGILIIDPPRYSYFDFNSDTAIADAEEGPDIRHPTAQEVGSCKRHGSCGRSALDFPVTVDSSRTAQAPAIRGAWMRRRGLEILVAVPLQGGAGSTPAASNSLPYGGASFFRGEREAADLSLFFRAAERQATIFQSAHIYNPDGSVRAWSGGRRRYAATVSRSPMPPLELTPRSRSDSCPLQPVAGG